MSERDRIKDALFEGIIGAKEGSRISADMALEAFLELWPRYSGAVATQTFLHRARNKPAEKVE